jgi:hypothetical protein
MLTSTINVTSWHNAYSQVCSVRDFSLPLLCEMNAVLEYYAAWSGSPVPTFQHRTTFLRCIKSQKTRVIKCVVIVDHHKGCTWDRLQFLVPITDIWDERCVFSRAGEEFCFLALKHCEKWRYAREGKQESWCCSAGRQTGDILCWE